MNIPKKMISYGEIAMQVRNEYEVDRQAVYKGVLRNRPPFYNSVRPRRATFRYYKYKQWATAFFETLEVVASCETFETISSLKAFK